MSNTNLSPWLKNKTTAPSFGRIAKKQRQLIGLMMEYGQALDSTTNTEDTNNRKAAAILTKIEAHINDHSHGIQSFQALQYKAIAAFKQRRQWQKPAAVQNSNEPSKTNKVSDYSDISAKNYDHTTQGYWACKYTTKMQEKWLLQASLALGVDNNGTTTTTNTYSEQLDKLKAAKGKEALTYLTKHAEDDAININPAKDLDNEAESTTEEDVLQQCVDLATEKYKPTGVKWIFYAGKQSVVATALGGSLCCALITMATLKGFGAPASFAIVGGAIGFALNLIFGVIMHRHKTPQTLVQTLNIGIFDDSEEKPMPKKPEKTGHLGHDAWETVKYSVKCAWVWVGNKIPGPLKQWRALAPLLLCFTFSALYGALTYVAGIELLGKLGAAAAPLAGFLAAVDFVTMGCVLFASAYKIWKEPKVWWNKNTERFHNAINRNIGSEKQNKALKYAQITYAVLGGLVILAALIWYFSQIGGLVFPSAKLIGTLFTTTIGVTASIPGVLDGAFWIAEKFIDLTANIIMKCCENYPGLAAPLAFMLFVTSPAWGIGYALYQCAAKMHTKWDIPMGLAGLLLLCPPAGLIAYGVDKLLSPAMDSHKPSKTTTAVNAEIFNPNTGNRSDTDADADAGNSDPLKQTADNDAGANSFTPA
jgi:hypothetical protein